MRRIRLVLYSIVYTLCKFIQNLTHNSIIHASANNVDVTTSIRFYYYIDNVLSVASMQRWLAKCGVKTSSVLIIFKTNEILRYSHIDLDNDKELLTNTDFTDVTIGLGLPYKNIQLEYFA